MPGGWHVDWSEPSGRTLTPPTLPPKSVEANLLLLGDLHLGADDFVAAWDNLFRKVLNDLDLIEPKIGKPWDAVVFVGDLVHNAAPEQFKDVDEVIRRPWGWWQKKNWSPRLLAVPGNHDLVCPRQWSPARECLASLHEKPKQIASALWAEKPKNDNKELRKFIDDCFKNYQAWWNSHAARWPAGLANKDLPGEFVATFPTTSGMKLGLMGLNSAVLHFRDIKRELPSLWIDERQFYRAGGTEWCEEHDVRLLVTHHPREAIHESNRQTFLSSICSTDQFDLHLCGHEHLANWKKDSERGMQWKQCVVNSALFAREHDAKDAERIHGYCGLHSLFTTGIGTFGCGRGVRILTRNGGSVSIGGLVNPSPNLRPDRNSSSP